MGCGLVGTSLAQTLSVAVDDDNRTGVENGSPQRPFTTIQGGAGAAPDGATLKVAQGTYPGSLAISGKSVTVIGGYQGGTAYPNPGNFEDGSRNADPSTNDKNTVMAGNGAPCRIECQDAAARGSVLTSVKLVGTGTIFRGGVVLKRVIATFRQPPSDKTDAPDFYQYRDPYPPWGSPGRAYCAPTASADAVVWLSEHGFTNLPGRSQEVSIVEELALDMDTDELFGTDWPDVVPGLNWFLGRHLYPGDFTVEGLGALDGGGFPDGQDLVYVAQRLAMPDSVIVVAASAYKGGTSLGGHAVFLAAVGDITGGNHQVVYVRDPATGPQESIDEFTLVWDPLGYYLVYQGGAPYDVPNLDEDSVRWVGAAIIQLR